VTPCHNILLGGYHRWKAYLKYNETHAERLKTLRDDETIPEPFEISEKLKQIWLDAKGISRRSVSDSLAKSGDDNFLPKIIEDLGRGHPVETVAGRHARSPVQDSYRARCALRWLVFVCQICVF
jgi:hypothetical protein